MLIHHEWGIGGVLQKADAMVIVDCLSFSTAVSVATNRGAIVYPFQFKQSAQIFADCLDMPCAQKRELGGISLSPSSLDNLEKDQRFVLPSPNGANLSLLAAADHVYSGSLRNAKYIADCLIAQSYQNVIIVSAGERWYDLDKTSPLLEKEDNRLRPCFEDMIAAGAIISYLDGTLSPEAKIAKASFDAISNNLVDDLQNSISGQELYDRGFGVDVEFAAKLNVDQSVPKLHYEKKLYRDFGISNDVIQNRQICYYKNII